MTSLVLQSGENTVVVSADALVKLMPASAEDIDAITEQIAQLPQIADTGTRHYKLKGVYLRRVIIPQGAIVVGKIHKKEHFAVIAKGKVGVSTNNGAQDVYEAGDIIVSEAGVQRCVVGLEESVFLTFHRTDAVTDEELFEDLVRSPRIDLYDFNGQLKNSQLAFERNKELK